jgi:peroxiredoxin
MLGLERGMLGFTPFTHAEPFKEIIERADRITYEGVEEVNGVPCHRIAVTMTFNHPALGKRTSASRWFIGVKDYLPRRLETEKSRMTAQIVEVNNPIDEAQFFLNVPEGYGEKLVTGKEPVTKGLLDIGSDAPGWKLPDKDGGEHSLSDYRGKIVVLDFWGTWCVPCRKSMPQIQALHEKFKDRGVVVTGIDLGEEDGGGDPVAFMKRFKFTYGLLLKGDATAQLYRASVLPTVYVIGPSGKILHAEFGYRENLGAELSAVIEQQLKAVGR